MAAGVTALHLTSRVQLNPRSLPGVVEGMNRFAFSSAESSERIAIPTPLDCAPVHALQVGTENGQQFLYPSAGAEGYALYKLESSAGSLTGFDVGARFLDMPDGIAPNKLTAETRQSKVQTTKGTAAISWSLSAAGPFRELWTYPETLQWKDGHGIDRLLRWPEVFREVRSLPTGTTHVYIKISTTGPAVDNLRLTRYQTARRPAGIVEVLQAWREHGVRREHAESLAASDRRHNFGFRAGTDIENDSVTIRCR
jgi:hypothetical protein